MSYLVLTGQPSVSPTTECTYQVHSIYRNGAAADDAAYAFMADNGIKPTNWTVYKKDFMVASGEKRWASGTKMENLVTRQWFALLRIDEVIGFLRAEEAAWPPSPEHRQYVNWSWPL